MCHVTTRTLIGRQQRGGSYLSKRIKFYWGWGQQLSPGQRPSVGDVKHLVRVEKLPEAVEELTTLQTATLWVDEHQQRTYVVAKLVHLMGGDNSENITTVE